MLRVERCLMQDWYCPRSLRDADVDLSSSLLWSEVGGYYPGVTTEKIVAQGWGDGGGEGEAIPGHTAVQGQSPLLTWSSPGGESGLTGFQYLSRSRSRTNR